MIRHDAKHLDGGHAANVRHLWRQTFSVLALAVSEHNLGQPGPVEPQIIVLRPTVYIIQFCRPGVGIRSWDNNVGIVSILIGLLLYRNPSETEGSLHLQLKSYRPAFLRTPLSSRSVRKLHGGNRNPENPLIC